MRMDRTFIMSKVGRRIFALFIFCAIVPILGLAIVSFTRVSGELESQNRRRMHQSCKSLGMSILERLNFLENEFKTLSANLFLNSDTSADRLGKEYAEDLKNRFQGLGLLTHTGKFLLRFGHIQKPAKVSPKENEHLSSGKALVVTVPSEGNLSRIYMIRLVDSQDPKQGILYGEINPMYLWFMNERPREILPYKAQLCVLDNSSQVIYATFPVPPKLRERPEYNMPRTGWGVFKWEQQDEKHMASFWTFGLKYNPLYPKWTLLLTVPTGIIGQPMAHFKKIFPFVVLLSFWVVLLLSFIQIRRTTRPLERLRDGTRRIAERDFESRVTVTSGDEFEELATSFNNMARQLGKQFNALTTMAEIDRAILSALDTERIVGTVINRMHEFFGYDFVSVTLLDSKSQNPARTFLESGNRLTLVENVEIPPNSFEKFMVNHEILLINAPEDLPSCLAPSARSGIKSFVLLPLFLKEELAGIITLGSQDSSPPNHEDLQEARQLADQVAVALSNAQLLEDLDALNWGTLRALARAVDAKSPWTAGHSERVTEKALKIGQVLGLTPVELDDLHRAGLLHDIGKIGTPVSILDKPGELTEEEFELIRSHSSMGARILEPIAAYEHAIPIVSQHHEHFDGKGYPEGLAGEEIGLGARILAVADVYDALVSDRPYRSGMEPERVIKIIKEEAGKQFDPTVVEAFLEVMEQEGMAR